MILGKYTDQQIYNEYTTNSTIIRFVNKLQNKFPTFSLEDKSTNDECDDIVTLTIYGTNLILEYYSKLRPYIFEAGFIASPILQQYNTKCFTKCFKPVEAEDKKNEKTRESKQQLRWVGYVVTQHIKHLTKSVKHVINPIQYLNPIQHLNTINLFKKLKDPVNNPPKKERM